MTPDPTNGNQVFLRGRLAAPAQRRELPSGDQLCSFRLTVPRPKGSRARVDSLDCAATLARVRRVLGRAEVGDELEVTGSLRRRFWRAEAGPASRYEVEVSSARVTSRRQTSA
jgi:single-strand DNA-binding protein